MAMVTMMIMTMLTLLIAAALTISGAGVGGKKGKRLAKYAKILEQEDPDSRQGKTRERNADEAGRTIEKERSSSIEQFG